MCIKYKVTKLKWIIYSRCTSFSVHVSSIFVSRWDQFTNFLAMLMESKSKYLLFNINVHLGSTNFEKFRCDIGVMVHSTLSIYYALNTFWLQVIMCPIQALLVGPWFLLLTPGLHSRTLQCSFSSITSWFADVSEWKRTWNEDVRTEEEATRAYLSAQVPARRSGDIRLWGTLLESWVCIESFSVKFLI